LKGQLSTLGPYVTNALSYTICLERKGKNLVVKFDVISAHDGLVGWECVTFHLLIIWFHNLICFPRLQIFEMGSTTRRKTCILTSLCDYILVAKDILQLKSL
jgi:hypothetical protein